MRGAFVVLLLGVVLSCGACHRAAPAFVKPLPEQLVPAAGAPPVPAVGPLILSPAPGAKVGRYEAVSVLVPPLPQGFVAVVLVRDDFGTFYPAGFCLEGGREWSCSVVFGRRQDAGQSKSFGVLVQVVAAAALPTGETCRPLACPLMQSDLVSVTRR